MANELDISIQKTMFDMDWVFVGGRSLCSIKDAKAALESKPWMIDGWMRQQRFQGVLKEEFVEALQKVVANHENHE